MKRWVVFTAAVLILHYLWEMAQGGLFVGMKEQPFAQAAMRCFKAALGDLVITAIAFASTALAVRRTHWPLVKSFVAPAVFILTGLVITIGFERFALATARWVYAPEMPTLFGVGISPIMQWVVIPLIELPLFRTIWRSTWSDSCNDRRSSQEDV